MFEQYVGLVPKKFPSRALKMAVLTDIIFLTITHAGFFLVSQFCNLYKSLLMEAEMLLTASGSILGWHDSTTKITF